MMRTRIFNASRPLSRQVRAVHSTTPVSKPIAERTTHNPALHCATCPFTTHERVYLKAPLTGGPFLPDDKLVKAIEKYYLTRAATAPTDYSGADSEKNYNVRTKNLEAARCEREDLIKELLIKQLAAKHEVSEREAKRVVRSLVRDVEGVREKTQRRGRREMGRQKKEQRQQRDYQREDRRTFNRDMLLVQIAMSEEMEVGGNMDVDCDYQGMEIGKCGSRGGNGW
ncbi:uncharacterized protein J4E79_005667 [Alternaria viburni]|uniref:uncharacterized protein n=1 Tax=Alternaria viburni TaxID=566460 RepID=UPI0020C415BE|nr:uncharacterized protein J4E79_005667 [Alternaria viburni]KAI4659865.1 hypothetical protein J4E79_005667 [Alternaria viburni]